MNGLLKALPRNQVKDFLKNVIGSDALKRIFFDKTNIFHRDEYQDKKEEVIAEAVSNNHYYGIKRSYTKKHYSVDSKEKVAALILALNIAENPDYPGDLPYEMGRNITFGTGGTRSILDGYFSEIPIPRRQPWTASFFGRISPIHSDSLEKERAEREIREYCQHLYSAFEPKWRMRISR